MRGNLFKQVCQFVFVVAIGALAAGWQSTPLYAQHDHMQHMGHQGPMMQMNHQGADHSAHQHSAAQPSQTNQVAAPTGPHGGRMTMMTPLTFEVVCQPQEIRLYMYGPNQQPQSVRAAKGEIALRVGHETRTTRVPLQYVAPPSSEQDYLSAKVDLSGLKDGEMTASFKLENLTPQKPTAMFGQPLALSKPKLEVTLGTVGPDDQTAIARQKVCPVTGAALGSMGEPIKVLVGGQPLYLCCNACVGKVQADPETYLQKAGHTRSGQ